MSPESHSPAPEAVKSPEMSRQPEAKFDTTPVHRDNLESRKNAIRPLLENKEGKDTALDAVFLGVESDLLKNGKEIVSALLDEELKKEPFSKVSLTEAQKSNLKVGILAKLSSGGIMAHMLNGISTVIGDKVWRFTNIFSAKKRDEKNPGDWTDILALFDSEKDKKDDKSEKKPGNSGLTELIKQAQGLTETALRPFAVLIASGNEVLYKQLLENPQLIAEYKGDQKLPAVTMDELSFLAKVNLNILQIDGSLRTIDQNVEKGLNLVAWVPGSVEVGLMKMLSGLLKVPFLKNIIALLMGYTSPEEVLAGTTEKLARKRAIISLRTFGVVKDDKGVIKWGENIGKIKWLENIDMTTLSDKKLEPFFKFCKDNEVGVKVKDGLDRQTGTFWTGLFTGEPKVEMTMKTGEKSERVACPAVDLEKVTDAESLIKALNALVGTQTEKPEEKKEEKPEEKKEVVPVDARASELAKMVGFVLPKNIEAATKKITLDKVASDSAELGNLIWHFWQSKNAAEKEAHAHLYAFVWTLTSLKNKNELNALITQQCWEGKNLSNVTLADAWSRRRVFVQKDTPGIDLTLPPAPGKDGKKVEKKESAEDAKKQRIEAIAAALQSASGQQETITTTRTPKTIEFKKNGEKWDTLFIDGQKYTLTVDAGKKNQFGPYLKKFEFSAWNISLDFSVENKLEYMAAHGLASGDPITCQASDLAEKIAELMEKWSVKIAGKSGSLSLQKQA